MKKIVLMSFLFFLLVIVSFFFVQVIHAGTEILYPTDDTFVSIKTPDGNFGEREYMRTSTECWSDHNREILIKFDVSSITSGSRILSAELNLYYYDNDNGNPAGRSLNLYRVTSDWSEDTVTWNDGRPTNSQFRSKIVVPSSPNQWMQWDVTNDIQGFVDGTQNNYGWKIYDDVGCILNSIQTIFRTKEYGSYIPYLEIEYAKLTMTSPKQGDTWYRGETHTIRWDTINAGNNVKIELYKNNIYDSTVTSSTPNTGTYSWTIPSGLSPSSSYKIRITSLTHSNVYDESSSFSIYEPSRYITVTSPKQGDTWYKGESYDIRWQSAFVGNNVKIEYVIGSNNYIIASNAPNTGAYSWTIPSGLSSSSLYKIRVTSLSHSNVFGESGFFTIDEQFIQINAPRSTSTWYIDETNTITWSSANAGNYVKIELYKNGIFDSTITSSTSNSGTYSWAIPSGLSPGSSYKIRVTSLSYSDISDESGSFSISERDRYITITSPKQGDTLFREDKYTIRWQSTHAGNNVKIEYGTGSSYNTIVSSTSNSGTYSWTIPSGLSLTASYKIRITSLSYSDIYDESGSFSIGHRYININRPHSTSTWYLGKANTITWNSANAGNSVRIELYRNTRLHSTIASNAPNTGTYSWTIPTDLSPSSSYRIRVSSRSFSNVDAYSSGYLTIEETFLQKWQNTIVIIALIIILTITLLSLGIRHEKNRKKKRLEQKKNEIKMMIHKATSEKRITPLKAKDEIEQDPQIQQDNITVYFKGV